MKRSFLLATMLLLQLSVQSMNLRYGDTVMISEPVYEDLYISAGTIHINANVYADLLVAGGNVIVRGKVYGDVLVIAGNCTLTREVRGDVRCIGGRLQVNGDIGEDLAASSGNINIMSGAKVAGDVLAGGGTIDINGEVKGYLKVYGGTLNMRGTVNKDLFFRGEVANINGTVDGASQIAASKLSLGSDATFSGPVHYWTEDNSLINSPPLPVGAVFDPKLAFPSEKWYYAGFTTSAALMSYLAIVLICISIGVLIFPKTFRRAAQVVQLQAGKALGSGLGILVLTPLIIAVLVITLIGIPLALILLIAYVSLMVFALVIIATLCAYWLELRHNRHWSKTQRILIAMALFIPIKMFSLIPIAGWLLTLAAATVSFGALWRTRKISHNVTN